MPSLTTRPCLPILYHLHSCVNTTVCRTAILTGSLNWFGLKIAFALEGIGRGNEQLGAEKGQLRWGEEKGWELIKLFLLLKLSYCETVSSYSPFSYAFGPCFSPSINQIRHIELSFPLLLMQTRGQIPWRAYEPSFKTTSIPSTVHTAPGESVANNATANV